MGFSETFKKIIGIEDVPEDEFEEAEIQEERKKIKKEEKHSQTEASNVAPPRRENPRHEKSYLQTEKKVSYSGADAMKLIVVSPSSYEDCPKLVDNLKCRRPVIINLEKIQTDTAKQIFEFLKGATYALGGNVKKITNNTFILSPESVDVLSNQEENSGFDFAQSKSPWK